MASSEEGLFELIRVSAFGEPSVLEVAKEKLESLKPKESEVLVRVLAAGINPVETYIRAGTYARKPALPYTPGTDGAGLVEQLGPDYDGPLKLGDRVWLAGSKTGTYAQYCLCAPSDVFPLPSSLSFPQGAALNIPYATAYRALFTRGGGKAGETVLIHGASGGVGVAAVQLAAKAGLRVIGTAGTPEGRALVTRLGAEAVFDHHQAGYLEDIRAFAAPFGGVDLIVEMIANLNLANDLTLLSIHGRVLIVGNRGALEINPRAIMAVEADVRGVALAHTSPEERRAAFEAINRGLQAGDLVPVAEDDAILPLSKAPQAHHDIIHTRRFGKLCLDPWSSASAL